MTINNEQIEFFQKAFKILQNPQRYPDGNKCVDYYKEIYKEEIKNKKNPYHRSLSPSCGSCIRHCVFTVHNDLEVMGIVDKKGEYND